MNELFILLQNASGAGWVILCALALAAVGMLIFDRRPAKRAAAAQAKAQERKAA